MARLRAFANQNSPRQGAKAGKGRKAGVQVFFASWAPVAASRETGFASFNQAKGSRGALTLVTKFRTARLVGAALGTLFEEIRLQLCGISYFIQATFGPKMHPTG